MSDDSTSSKAYEMRKTSTSDSIVVSPFKFSEWTSATSQSEEPTPCRTESTFTPQTLSTYLINYKKYNLLLSFCGGLHIPIRLNYNDLKLNFLNIWRVILMVFVGFMLYMGIGGACGDTKYSFEKSELYFLWPMVGISFVSTLFHL